MVNRLRAAGIGLALSGVAVLAAEPAMPPQENVLDYESRPQRNVLADPDIPVEGPGEPEQSPAPPWQDEEDALWVLLSRGRLDALDEQIARMRSEWPDWAPPGRLMALAGEARTRRLIETADDPALVSLAADHPEFFDCSNLGNAWQLAEALGRVRGRAEEAAAYRRLLSRCRFPGARIATLSKLRPLVTPGEFLVVVNSLADEDPELAARSDFRKMDLEARREVAATAARSGDFDRAVAVLEPASGTIRTARDSDAAALLAWAYARTGLTLKALEWEERLASWGVRRGAALAQARLAAGDPEGALAAAEAAAPTDADAAQLAFGLRSQRAAAAADCQERLDELAAARQWGALSVDQERLEAWALDACGQHREAADRFAALYSHTKADEDARGIVVADFKARRLQHALALSESLDGPLAERLPAGPLPTRGDTIDYGRLSVSTDGRLTVLHRKGWWSAAGLGFQSRQGDGPGRLDAWRAPMASAAIVDDEISWRFDVDRLDLSADPASPGDWPLALNVPYSPAMDTGTRGLVGRFEWRRDGAFAGTGVDIEASVGFTPTGQDISPTFTGRLAFGRGDESAGWTAGVERSPVRESLTSWTGTGGRLTIAGTTYRLPFQWGRVTRNGLVLSGYGPLDENWRVAGSARGSAYVGENVPTNTGGEVYLELQRTLANDGTWRYSAGPWLYSSAFGDNLGHFSPGHGGYFSPAWLAQGGLSARAGGRGASGDWYVDARLDLGWQRHEEDPAPLIPDAALRERFLSATGLSAADLGTFASRSRSGFAGGIELEGMRRLGRSAWHVGGLLSLRFAPQYDETTAMLVIRYGSGAAVESAERHFRRDFSTRR